MTNRLKVLFYGTPAFALPTFEAVLRHHDVVAVVTQPDRPAHRGQRVTAPPVKTRALGADVGVVVAFGQILPQAVLDAPRRDSAAAASRAR